jgi:hypothetical protein
VIVVTALASELTLVTHNIREFGRVPALKLEDWEVWCGAIHAKLYLLRVGAKTWPAVGSLNGGEVSTRGIRDSTSRTHILRRQLLTHSITQVALPMTAQWVGHGA